jgi:hypothetical protein
MKVVLLYTGQGNAAHLQLLIAPGDSLQLTGLKLDIFRIQTNASL